MAVDIELNKAVEAAEAELKGETPAAEETPVEETPVETSEAETVDELTEDQINEAKTLYKALASDPQGSVQQLMNAVGIRLPTDVKPETPQELRAAKKAITEILSEELGQEYKFLAPVLGKALDKVLEQERQETLQLKSQMETDSINSQVARATDKLIAETKGEYKKYEKQVAELSDKIHPGPNTSVEEYLRTLYTLASAGSTKKSVQTQLADKIRRNANDIPARLSQGAGANLSNTPIPKTKGISGAVEAAYQQLAKQSKG